MNKTSTKNDLLNLINQVYTLLDEISLEVIDNDEIDQIQIHTSNKLLLDVNNTLIGLKKFISC